MNQAKLLNLNEMIEEEVNLEINGLKFVGFANVCPYQIIPGVTYPINIGLTFLDNPELVEIKEKKYGLTRIANSYSYMLAGKVIGNSIDLGNGLKIEDDIFLENSYLDGHFVKLKTDRLSIEFL